MEKKYQIFISSTYIDLVEARVKVRDAILSMLHFPVGMEMFNAADEEQWEIIQETIDSSDYYVLILGQRYGSEISDGPDAGISYTEKEFRYAREQKIPTLVFIIDDSVPLKKEFIETDPEKQAKLDAFKEEAKQNRLVKWWKNEEELARLVMGALYQEFGRKKRPGWVRGDSFDLEASHAEILALNKRVRELEQENQELRSHMQERKPELSVSFLLDENEEDAKDKQEFCSHGDLLLTNDQEGIKIKLAENHAERYGYRYEPISKEDAEPYLWSYLTKDSIEKYNEALPDQKTVDQYVNEMKFYETIQKGGVALGLKAINLGTAKAQDVRIQVTVPDDFVIFDMDHLEKIKEPTAPTLPENPIEEARKKYERTMFPVPAWARSATADMVSVCSPIASTLDLLRINRNVGSIDRSFSVKGQTVYVSCRQILHRDAEEFYGFYLVPTVKGKGKINIRMMCSEYLEPEEYEIDIEVV